MKIYLKNKKRKNIVGKETSLRSREVVVKEM